MKLIDVLRMCLRNLTKRKMRTFLTVSGVMIGTCAIIVMISLGVGMTEAQKSMISEWADLTLIEVYNYGGMKENGEKIEKMSDDVLKKFAEIEGVKAVTPFYSYMSSGNEIAVYTNGYMFNWSQLVGCYMDQLEDFGYSLSEGRWKEKKDPQETVIFGQMTAGQLMDYNAKEYINVNTDENGIPIDSPVDPMKDEIYIIPLTRNTETWESDYTVIDSKTAINKLYEAQLNVIGVLKGSWKDSYTMQGIFVDIDYMKKIIANYNELNPDNKLAGFDSETGYENVRIRVDDMENVENVQKEIEEYGYQTYSDNQSRDNMKKQTQTIQMVLGALAAVSLFVAALNITNTMVMSIYERTKEIGIMKVLGCDISRIRLLFLCEAASIGFIGGVLGIFISYVASFVLNTFLSGQLMGLLGGEEAQQFFPDGVDISIIEPWLVFAALGFATVVGLVAGFSPANRSVKISALSAIRNE